MAHPERPEIDVKILRLRDGVTLPLYATDGAAAMDVASTISVEMAPGSSHLIPTGFALGIPSGYEGQLRPRSGIASKYGVTLLNSPATIDADYRGEVSIPLINLGRAPFEVRVGMRVAQLLVLPVPRVCWKEVRELPPTARGNRGFGHTGD